MIWAFRSSVHDAARYYRKKILEIKQAKRDNIPLYHKVWKEYFLVLDIKFIEDKILVKRHNEEMWNEDVWFEVFIGDIIMIGL